MSVYNHKYIQKKKCLGTAQTGNKTSHLEKKFIEKKKKEKEFIKNKKLILKAQQRL